ncbi:MAG: 6-phosphogluconolactonase, partial [Acidiferrobacterales bacterium]
MTPTIENGVRSECAIASTTRWSMVEPDIRCHADVSELVDVVARVIAERIAHCIKERGNCRFALAGGATPRPIYERLAQADLAGAIDWARVQVFWGDERCVGLDDEASNYRMAYTALLAHVPVTEANVHRIEGERGSVAAARRYAETLGDQPLDLVLL